MTRFIRFCSILALGVGLAAGPAFAAGIFLETTTPSIPGDATLVGYEGQIEIHSLDSGAFNGACSGGPLDVTLYEAYFTKSADSATVPMMTALRDRTVIKDAEFSLVANLGGAGNATYQTFVFHDAVLSSYGTHDDTGMGPGLEVWTMSYSMATVSYTTFNASGNPVGTDTVVLTPASCVGN